MTGNWRRFGWGAAAAAAAGVAVVFATVGDGVEVPGATGPRQLLVEHGHTAVWLLLAAAFGVATVHDGWTRPANALAVAAGAGYLTFLAAVFLWP